MTGPGYDHDLAERVTALTRADPAAVTAIYTAGQDAGRRDTAAYWRVALAPLDAAVRRYTTTHDLTPYAELARRRSETWDPDAGRWRPLPARTTRTPARPAGSAGQRRPREPEARAEVGVAG